MSERVTGLGPGSEVTDVAKFRMLPVAASDLVAWYPFRSGTGEDITAGDSRFGDTTDYSAVVNGATYKPSGGVTDIQTGANSGAFDFDGVDDRIQTPFKIDDLGSTTDFTISFFVNADAITSSTPFHNNAGEALVGMTGNKGNDTFDILLGSDDTIYVYVDDGTEKELFASNQVTTNQFFHIAVTHDYGNKSVLFNNGVKIATLSHGERLGDENNLYIGGSSKIFFDGTIDGVRIYQTILSNSQINQIYLNTKP